MKKNLHLFLILFSVLFSTSLRSETWDIPLQISDGNGSGSPIVALSPPVTTSQNAQVCEGGALFLQGAWRSSAGIYIDTFPAAMGGDSVVTTTLAVYPVYDIHHTIYLCGNDSVLLYGNYIKTDSTIVDHTMSSHGCDSTVTTAISVHTNYHITDSVTICTGDSIRIGGIYRNTLGNYNDTLQSIFGCDSIRVRHLIVHSITPVQLGSDTLIAPGNVVILEAGTGYTHYQWSSGHTFHSIVVNQSDLYFVIVTDFYGCKDTDYVYVSVPGTGINELHGITNFRVYPVPTTGSFFLELNAETADQSELIIEDVVGRELEKQRIEIKPGKNIFEGDLSKQSNGIYFIQLRGSFGTIKEKVIRQK